jgi:PncC family amidohydrolase
MSEPGPGASDHEKAFANLVHQAKSRGLSIGAAESLTGGLFGYLLTREEGAGEVFRGSLVTYQTAVKRTLLGVEGPVITGQAASQMADAALSTLNCDVCVGLTGVAGPDTQEDVDVGNVFIGVASRSGELESQHFHFDGDPDTVRHKAAAMAAELALTRVNSLPRANSGERKTAANA